ncbi:MAG: HEAT repeat domain-containing protein [Phycisphaerales bacterium]|nr:HEAT repeat domain-containing protein [Phycisphaerales bacterium]
MARFVGGARAVAAGLSLAVLGGCALDGRPGARTLWEAFAPATPAEAALMALDEEDPDRRFRGTMLLANAPWGGEEVYLVLYRDYIEDSEPNVRAAAARALGNHGRPADAALLVTALEDPEPMVRIEAAQALQRLHAPDAVQAMLRRLRRDIEPDPDIRAELAHGLGQYAERRVLDELVRAMNDRSLRVIHNASLSLKTLTGQDFGYDHRAWARWVADASDPFTARRAYVYPAFYREKFFLEYLPFTREPPNEQAASPAGMSPELGVR